MIARAEELFGPYEWDRYDMLVLPPSFPYGGMENPRMTFLTPDAPRRRPLAGRRGRPRAGPLLDRQPRHERDMEHFWLNEGFTVWAERRHPRGAARRGGRGARLGDRRRRRSRSRSRASAPTRRSPRCAPSSPASIPTTPSPRSPTRRARASWPCSSATAGRARFDRFMRDYMARFRFTSITTEEFLAFLEARAAGRRRRGGRAAAGSTSRACRRTRRSSAPPALDALVALAAALRRAASARRPPQIAALVAGRDARLPAEPAARARPRRLRLARRRARAHRPRQLRDPRRVADHRRGLRLRAGLPARCARCCCGSAG